MPENELSHSVKFCLLSHLLFFLQKNMVSGGSADSRGFAFRWSIAYITEHPV